ncbi:M48 family metalloprotease [Candidatus Saccharibacteria bacterium]|nr:M48 family metalloprotease [Candidatus Saccharibacteria bacterium]MBR2989615.1 M48 family metalloprotease [Candidatus Saccharibacteria bacterium]
MYKQIAANKRRTIFLMLFFVALIGLIGGIFAYFYQNLWVEVGILVIATGYAVLQYFAAGSLAVAMTGAHQIEKKDNPKLYNAVENISITTGLPMPKVYIIDDPAPNAFATGRDPKHAIVAATTGLLDIMDKSELEAVMAHEMSHVKNYDIRVSMITFGLVCLVGLISDIGLRLMYVTDDDDRSPVGAVIMLITAIFAPLAASLAQLAVSRQREFLADASAVNITRHPDGMISALKKLDEHARPMRHQNAAAEALYINSGLKKGAIANLFSTHPPIEKRIERLENGKKTF